MARDLILGRTKRDWSCGLQPLPTRAERSVLAEHLWGRVWDKSEAAELGRRVDTRFRQIYKQVTELQASGKMTPVVRQEFGKLYRLWHDFSLPKDGKFEPSDYVELLNFRDALQPHYLAVAALAAQRSEPRNSTSAPPQGSLPSPTKLVLQTALGAGMAAVVVALAASKLRSHPQER